MLEDEPKHLVRLVQLRCMDEILKCAQIESDDDLDISIGPQLVSQVSRCLMPPRGIQPISIKYLFDMLR